MVVRVHEYDRLDTIDKYSVSACSLFASSEVIREHTRMAYLNIVKIEYTGHASSQRYSLFVLSFSVAGALRHSGAIFEKDFVTMCGVTVALLSFYFLSF